VVPTTFTGEREKWETFIIQAHFYFAHYPDYFADQRNRGIYLLSWMEGENIRNWVNAILVTMGTPYESPLLGSWYLMIETATTLFGPINPEQTAREELRTIQQRTTVTDYHARFLRNATRSGYNEEALVDAFYTGLKEPIKDMMVNIQRPETLNSLLSVAVDYEARILARAKERKKNEPKRPWFSGKPTTINATKLSQEERTKRMKEGRCFICNQTGHMARTCPKRQNQQINKAEETKEEETKEEEDF
jgi:hypothetical protein